MPSVLSARLLRLDQGIVEPRRVREVERFHPELHVHALADPEVAKHAEVPGSDAGPAQDVEARGSEPILAMGPRSHVRQRRQKLLDACVYRAISNSSNQWELASWTCSETASVRAAAGPS